MSNWHIFTGDPGTPTNRSIPEAPPWRRPGKARDEVLAQTFLTAPEILNAVNAAIYLRRPLLVTGKPGSGKSSLIYAVAAELKLGKVLTWAINSRSTLRDALYTYDALARLQYLQEAKVQSPDAVLEAKGFGHFLSLGPVGTALASKRIRAVLVDEIDKSDVDLPNDLLNVMDTGRFTIQELKRLDTKFVPIPDSDGEQVMVERGEVTFEEFPFVVMTSNGERDFPAPFLRRCIQVQMPKPGADELRKIVLAHFQNKLSENDPDLKEKGTREGKEDSISESILAEFLELRENGSLSTDQVLNAFHVLRDSGQTFSQVERKDVLTTLFTKLG
jgi:MoxR-like ATPase